MMLYLTSMGAGRKKVVFLHGLWGGGNYFREFGWLDDAQTISYYPDELGFGSSPKPTIAYTPEAHCQALHESLTGPGPYTIVGHSFGTILAVHFATKYPELVNKLILVSPLVYASVEEARLCLKRTLMLRVTLDYPGLAHALCKTVCSTGILSVVSPFFTRGHKKHYIKGCTLHTWHSYYSTVIDCLLAEPITPLITKLAERLPIHIYTGASDPYLAKATFDALNGPFLNKFVVPNQGHNVLFTKFEESKQYINQTVMT